MFFLVVFVDSASSDILRPQTMREAAVKDLETHNTKLVDARTALEASHITLFVRACFDIVSCRPIAGLADPQSLCWRLLWRATEEMLL